MILEYETEQDRRNLILKEETIQKFNYDPSTLGRHSKLKVVFKCIICSLPHENSNKLLLDKKGITHPGECRLVFKKLLGKQARVNENPSIKELRKQKLREKINKDKDIITNKRHQTLIEKYGTKNFSEIESIRKNISKGIQKAYKENGREILSKRQTTNLEKYNSTNYLTSKEGSEFVKKNNQQKFQTNFPFENKQFQQDARNLYIEKAGISNPSKDPQIVIKRQETNIEKYGVPNPLQNQQIKQKREKTNIEKYGFPQPSHSLEVRKKIGLSLSTGELISDIYRQYQVPPCSAQRILKEYGEEAFWDFCKNYSGPPSTTLEQRLIRLLQPEIQTFHYNKQPTEFKTSSKPDFRLQHNNKTLYVNVDGLYWHSEICFKDRNNYHQILSKSFRENNLLIMQFREDEIRDKSDIIKSIIFNYLDMSSKIHARKCIIKPLSFKEAKIFFDNNHLMGHIASTAYGLFFEQELVCAISLKRKDQQQIEIARFATKKYNKVQGGFSKLLKYVIKQYNPSKIISFCDLRYANGHSYQKLGFKLESISQGWQWTDFKNTYNRLRCRANMDDRKFSEKQHAEELGWFKIYDAGQAKYVLDLTLQHQ